MSMTTESEAVSYGPGVRHLTDAAADVIELCIPRIEGDQADIAAFRRSATLLYTLMATGMREAEANRRLRNEYGPRYEG